MRTTTAATVAVVACAAAPTFGEVPHRTVALSGTQVPGEVPGVRYASLFAPSVASDGTVAFAADYPVDGRVRRAVLVDDQGAARVVARNGMPLNLLGGQMPGAQYKGTTLGPTAAVGGAVLFRASPDMGELIPPRISFLAGRDGTRLAAPVWSTFTSINHRGWVGSARGTGGSYTPVALYAGPPEAPQLLAAVGQAVPQAGGRTIARIEGAGPVGRDGQVVFRAALDPDGAPIWLAAAPASDTGASSLRVLAGPDTPSVVPFAPVNFVAASRTGEAAFIGTFSNGVGDNNTALAVSRGGAITVVAREGDTAPGSRFGFDDFVPFEQSDLGDDGTFAFVASAGGAEGVWKYDGRETTVLSYPGNAVQGLRPGDRFGSASGRPLVDPAGNVLFHTHIVDADGFDRQSLLLAAPDGSLTEIVRAGDPFEVAPDDVRRIGTIMYAADRFDMDYTYPRSLSDGGEVGFYLLFADGSSGVFVATVPEPAAAALGLAVSPLLLLRRRRRALA